MLMSTTKMYIGGFYYQNADRSSIGGNWSTYKNARALSLVILRIVIEACFKALFVSLLNGLKILRLCYNI